jgi:Bacterial regulatory proteins, tetR family
MDDKSTHMTTAPQHGSKTKLLDSALQVIHAKGYAATTVQDICNQAKLYAPRLRWSAESVGYFIQSVLQGSFVFAKAKQSPDVVRENLEHLQRYLEALFNHGKTIKESSHDNYR